MSDFPYYFTWCHQPECELFPVNHAEHDEFVLNDGRRIYDFLSTSFQSNFGHSHAAIKQAIRAQLDEMPIASPKASFELKERVSHRLQEMVGLPNGKVFYTVSGSESVENALKMARQLTGRTKVLARRRSYHGASLGALSVTGDWRNDAHFTIDEQTVRIPEPERDPDLRETRDTIRQAGPQRVAAVILETITGANGVIIPAESWFDGIQALCHEYDLLMIVDEVLCGFGRTGPPFAFNDYQLQPDFVCMSKGISGGYLPFGAVWTGPRVNAYYESEMLACGLTSYGHPLGLAATEAVLGILNDPEFKRNKQLLEEAFGEAIDQIARMDHVRTTRRKGLLAAIELADQAAPSWDFCFDRGLHLFSKHNLLVLAPPLVSTPERLREACNTLHEILANLTVTTG